VNTQSEISPDKRARYRARCIVNGMRKHGKTGKLEPDDQMFSELFLPHPWVRESISEGWDRELRQYLIHIVTLRIMQDKPTDVIEDLMPSRQWVDDAKHHAARYAAASAWQKENLPESFGFSALLSRIKQNAGL
jgi:hypothetical protein